MRSSWIARVIMALWVVLQSLPLSADEKDAVTDPADAGESFALQGEYLGTMPHDDGTKVKIGVQVVALGNGKFDAVGCPGGLPGDGWNGERRFGGRGELKEGVVLLTGEQGRARLANGKLEVLGKNGAVLATLSKIHRKSPTLGAKPPDGAVVLFDGSSAEPFQGGKLTKDKLLMMGATSKQKFRDLQLHLEFRTPFMPLARGQGRGNSGVYLGGRHEVQVLDSFGLEGKNNECGGIYSVKAPDVNMCFPPLSWQTYDIEYRAPRFAEDGTKKSHARITVKHNGVVIHDNVEIPHATTAAPVKESGDPGPLYLQNHGNPVYFRNIWLVEGETE